MIKQTDIYTDGSCHPQTGTGSWAAYIIYDNNIKKLYSLENNTSHNRMEIEAVIKSLEYCMGNSIENIRIFTDSQYVINIPKRFPKLEGNNFLTKSGKEIRNKDLLIRLNNLIKKTNPELIKVKAHQKKGDKINYNREVDKLSRKILRDALK